MSREDKFLYALALLTLVLLVLMLMGCTAPNRSKAAAEAAGFRDVKTEGYAWFSCGGDDEFATEFEGVNAQGDHVVGVVCCGLFKSCTVRF